MFFFKFMVVIMVVVFEYLLRFRDLRFMNVLILKSVGRVGVVFLFFG